MGLQGAGWAWDFFSVKFRKGFSAVFLAEESGNFSQKNIKN